MLMVFGIKYFVFSISYLVGVVPTCRDDNTKYNILNTRYSTPLLVKMTYYLRILL